MDSLTHTVIGACIGDAVAGKKMGKKAMLWGALANNLPDIDVVTSLWMSQADSLLAHRGFTHSILFAVLATPLLSWFFHRRFIRHNILFNDWLLLFGSNLFIHIGIDAFTAYGTAWFEPFSHDRVSMNLIFVADLLYTLPFLLVAIILMAISKHHPRRVFWQRFAILLNLIYVGFALRNKIDVDQAARDAFKSQRITTVDYFTTPTPLNNFLWYIVGKTDEGYYLGYRSILDECEVSPMHYVSRNDSLLIPYRDLHEVKQLIRFSEGFYSLSSMDSTVVLNDLRFGQTGGWYKPDAPFVFRYALSENANNDLVIQRGRMEASSGEAIRQILRRISGCPTVQ